jgi:AcrR family transcriptional regulator
VSDTVATPAEVTARPLRADARRNRERILKAARSVFAKYGREAQMDDVARRAKLGVGTLYRHFPTKDALLQALAQDKFDRLQRAACDALEVEDAWQAFAGFIRGAADQMAADRALYEAVQHTDARDAAERAGLRGSLQTLIARGQSAGAVRADLTVDDIPMFMCALGSAIAMACGDDARWRRHLELALDGLRARSGA